MRWRKYTRTLLSVAIILITLNILFEEEVNAKQEELAQRVLRFHIRANSDSEEDQNLKLKVKEAVTEYISILLESSESAEQSAAIIKANMTDILNIAQSVIVSNGYDYNVSGYIVNEYFPLKVYADVALPPGYYNAFRIDIGNAQGRNWWCILYPALCFADITHGVVDEECKEELKIEFKYLKFMNKWVE
jgi:stage II sporulation protein R